MEEALVQAGLEGKVLVVFSDVLLLLTWQSSLEKLLRTIAIDLHAVAQMPGTTRTDSVAAGIWSESGQATNCPVYAHVLYDH